MLGILQWLHGIKDGNIGREKVCSASELRTGRLEMDISFVGYGGEMGCQWRLAALLADWRRNDNITAVSNVAYSGVHKDGSQL